MAAGEYLKVTLLKSIHGRLENHQACVRGLGLRRRHHSVVVEATPENRGMINKVAYLLQVEPAPLEPAPGEEA
ncbi:MAG: 50S ribosomal protein L30 [Candidatus Competibacterales bacterium]